MDRPSPMMPQEIHWNYLGNTFTWKDGRKLESITKADGSAITYTYDSEGNRIGKQIRKPDGIEEKTTYYWDGGKLLREVSGDETLYYSYDSNGKLWSMDWEKGDTKKGYFVIRNAQGDITGLYHREDSSLAGSYTYDAWGQLLSVNPANESDGEILRKNPFRYRGYYYDEESGYYFLQSRYYNPEVRRFLNADTLVAETGNGVGYNLFAYSSNQPVNYKDESGHVLDTVMDVVSIGIDVVEIAQNPTDPVSWICLGADVACAVIPVATGGGLAVRAAGKVDDAVDAAKTADHVGDVVKDGINSDNFIINELKNAAMEYRKNPVTGNIEPYMKQIQINEDYKVLLRRDIGDFNHGDLDHWNLEVQTINGKLKYDLHLYLDEAGNVLPFSKDNIYIPKKSPFH